jgi:hypothetical protein
VDTPNSDGQPSDVVAAQSVQMHSMDSPASDYLMAALGTRLPLQTNNATTGLSAYREHFGIDGSDPLGPRPFETFPPLAYDEVTAQIRQYERVRWRERRRPSPGIETGALVVQEIRASTRAWSSKARSITAGSLHFLSDFPGTLTAQ